MLAGHELGKERLRCGSLKGPDHAVGQQDSVNRKDRGDAEQGEDEEGGGTHREDGGAHHEDGAAGQAVGGVAGEKEKKDTGEKLRQSDHAKVEGAVGEIEICQPTATACISDEVVARKRAVM